MAKKRRKSSSHTVGRKARGKGRFCMTWGTGERVSTTCYTSEAKLWEGAAKHRQKFGPLDRMLIYKRKRAR